MEEKGAGKRGRGKKEEEERVGKRRKSEEVGG